MNSLTKGELTTSQQKTLREIQKFIDVNQTGVACCEDRPNPTPIPKPPFPAKPPITDPKPPKVDW